MSYSNIPKDIIELAKWHLDFPASVKDQATLDFYLAELKTHLSLNRKDTNFRIQPQPKTGYGVVTCLETGCGKSTIKLTKRKANDSEDGKSIGIGSLSGYRVHVFNSMQHKESVATRTRKQDGGSPEKHQIKSLSLSPEKRQAIHRAFLTPSPAKASPTKRRLSLSTSPRNPPPLEKLVTPLGGEPSGLLLKKSQLSVELNDPQPEQTAILSPAEVSPPSPKRRRVEICNFTEQTIIPTRLSPSTSNPNNANAVLYRERAVGDDSPLAKAWKRFANERTDSLSRPPRVYPAAQSSLHRPQPQPVASGSNVTLDMIDGPVHHTPPPQFQRGGIIVPRLCQVESTNTPSHGDEETSQENTNIPSGAGHNEQAVDYRSNVLASMRRLGLHEVNQIFPGMTVSLMPYQVIGVAWMLQQELRGRCKGGILADDMGLGKTIEMIALMVRNRSPNEPPQPILIVAPLSVVDQWHREIRTKTDPKLSCLVYHGPGKPKFAYKLRTYDVVLTTYGTLKQQHRRVHACRARHQSSSGIVKAKRPRGKEPATLLFQIFWFRVILDEAHEIRNHRTLVSSAVADLDAEYRWCLTGTPIINSLADAYGLLRFLHIPRWNNWQKFYDHVVTHEKSHPLTAMSNLHEILNDTCIRRKKDSLLDGKPLIELPLKCVRTVKLDFSAEERAIYDSIEQKSQMTFNRFFRAGTVLKNYVHVLVMIVRLRQICFHPALTQNYGVAYVNPNEALATVEKSGEVSRAIEAISRRFVNDIRKHYLRVALERAALSAKHAAETALDDEESLCAICMDRLADPVVTACAHVFCRICIITIIDSSPSQSFTDDSSDTLPPPSCQCPICDKTVRKHCVFSRAAFEPTTSEMEAGKLLPTRSRRREPHSLTPWSEEDSMSEDDEDEGNSMCDFIVETDEDEKEHDARHNAKRPLTRRKRAVRRIILDSGDEDEDEDADSHAEDDLDIDLDADNIPSAISSKIPPSAKMIAMMELIRKWAQEHPNDKILVISQWTQCLQLVSDFLRENGFSYVRYQGDMDREERERAVRSLMSEGRTSIMLLSLKCGGVGLNLTRANRIINLDLAWSLAVEHQAYDRVHRVGQTRPVHVKRLVVRNTIEDRILALQERKQLLADGSLGDRRGGTGPGRLGVNDLAKLFGLNPDDLCK